jgi:sugar phosphate isomerase/epimerase
MNAFNLTFTRREMITRLITGSTLMALSSRFAASTGAAAAESTAHYPIGACDWSIGKMADPTGLALAKEIGLDGLQVSLGTEANDMHLRREEVQRQYLKASEETGVKIASLAIGELNRVPYKSDPQTIDWVSDSVDVAHALGCRVVLLAFFGNGDLKGDKKGTDEVVRRLRDVAPKAEEKGVTLGIESWLSADEHLDIIERVGSSAVKVYYDVANSHKMG